MKITVKSYATLAKYQPGDGTLEMPEGSTVASVLETLSIDPEEVKITFVNSAHAPLDKELQDGDRIGLFPAVGGG